MDTATEKSFTQIFGELLLLSNTFGLNFEGRQAEPRTSVEMDGTLPKFHFSNYTPPMDGWYKLEP